MVIKASQKKTLLDLITNSIFCIADFDIQELPEKRKVEFKYIYENYYFFVVPPIGGYWKTFVKYSPGGKTISHTGEYTDWETVVGHFKYWLTLLETEIDAGKLLRKSTVRDFLKSIPLINRIFFLKD